MNYKEFTMRLLLIVMAALTIASCGADPTPDLSLISTEIASTIYTEMTSTAMAMPTATATPENTPTPQPSPTATATQSLAAPTTAAVTAPLLPTTTGDNSKYIADMNIPDGTVVNTGDVFDKTWKFENTGTTTWTTAYTLRYVEGNLFGDDNNATYVFVPVAVAPGKSVEISVPFRAPEVAGSFNSLWKLYNADGIPFGEYVTINIIVK
ncbi:MAG TPA: NBR1-Ig-like domain-containing protein [Anaerolineaceae bacterium]|nr:NBR1-Ig-like domain-containing protein [Anaerolineaceae bacterium]